MTAKYLDDYGVYVTDTGKVLKEVGQWTDKYGYKYVTVLWLFADSAEKPTVIIGRWLSDDLHRNIDPGKKGALAVIRDDGSVRLAPYDKRAYIDVLSEYGDLEAAVVCLEHVSAMPGQGVTSMFSFGESFGWLQGVLDAYGIRYELVRPQKWKKEYSVTADKNGSIEVARRLFPSADLRRTEKCRTDDDGIAEALLMAEYARRHF